jgi:hypothetical protein
VRLRALPLQNDELKENLAVEKVLPRPNPASRCGCGQKFEDSVAQDWTPFFLELIRHFIGNWRCADEKGMDFFAVAVSQM